MCPVILFQGKNCYNTYLIYIKGLFVALIHTTEIFSTLSITVHVKSLLIDIHKTKLISIGILPFKD